MLLDECRWLYNLLLEQRILSFEELDTSLSKYDQMMFLPYLKLERTTLNKVHSQVLQQVVDRLDKAYQNFFRRCKDGEKPGYPRFQGKNRYKSLCYPQSGFTIIGKELRLSKIGTVRMKMHRPIEGNIKTCTLKMDSSGNWDVIFSCEVDSELQTSKQEHIGIDFGLQNFATLSNGEIIKNPRFHKKAEKKIAKAQRKLDSLEDGSKEKRKQKKVVAKVHERIKNQRKDFCHKESRKIVNQYQYICVEDLDIKNMVEGSFLAKNIMDASWNQFLQFLTYKAAEAGRKLGVVNPAYTTQDCSQCKHREKKKLSERTHCCSQCGYTTTRDLNAAQNILALGLDGLGINPRSLRL